MADIKEDKEARIWSDWHSSGVCDKAGVCVDEEELPVSNYALSLIRAMQSMYDSQSICWKDETVPFKEDHYNAYIEMKIKAVEQVRKELPDWNIS